MTGISVEATKIAYYKVENNNLKNKISALEDRNANEYIDLAEILMRYKSALFKIAYIENEWDDPLDFIKDLKDIAKEALIN
jgi:hypothetical protein